MYSHKKLGGMEEWVGKREKRIQVSQKKISNSFLEYDIQSKAIYCTIHIFTKNGPCMHFLFPTPIDRLAFLLK